jgi:hypothetical protein
MTSLTSDLPPHHAGGAILLSRSLNPKTYQLTPYHKVINRRRAGQPATSKQSSPELLQILVYSTSITPASLSDIPITDHSTT